MRFRTPVAWFAAATIATLAITHAGYDTSEGSDHALVALHWLQTGRIGMAEQPTAIFLRGPDGLMYPVHELGNILWLAPAAAAGLAAEAVTGRSTVAGDLRLALVPAQLMGILFVTLTGVGFWKLLEWGTALGARTRLLASALLVFATMLLPFARMTSDVVATGAWLIWGAAFAVRAGARADMRSALFAGVCIGCAVLTRVPAVVSAAPVLLTLVALAPPRRRWAFAAAAIAAGLPALAAFMWFNDLRTGSPFLPAFMLPQYATQQPTGNILAGVAGLLFSPGKSIFLFSPVLLLALAGFPRMWREYRVLALMAGASVVLFLLAHGGLWQWHADWSWGPRHFLFVLPFAWLPGVFALDALGGRRMARASIVGLIAISLAVQAAAIAINWQYQYQLMWHQGRMTEAMYWSADNQFTDALRAAAANVARTAGADIAAPIVPGASQRTVAASTGINVWWISALRMGLAPWAIVPAVLALAMFAVFAWRRTLASVRREDAGSGLDLGLSG